MSRAQDRKDAKVATSHAAESSLYEHADGLRIEITLPRLCGSRSGADALVHRIEQDLSSKIIVLNARLTSVGTAAYADELLALLRLRGATEFELTPTTAEFQQSLLASAQLRRLSLTFLG